MLSSSARSARFRALVVVVALEAAACAGGTVDAGPAGPGALASGADFGGGGTRDPEEAPWARPDGGAAPSDDGRGLPCEVSDLLDAYCVGCHGGGGLVRLVDADDLRVPSLPWVRRTLAELAVLRMREESRPMPPRGRPGPTDAEIDAFADWVSAGQPHASCDDGDAGAPGPDAAVDPYDSPVMCSSGTTWGGGFTGSEFMYPGRACVSCHAGADGPPFPVAGTLYPSAHEPDDCNGGPAGAVVVLTDANQKEHRFTANEVGNFFAVTNVAMPYTARVEYQGRVREMLTPQTSGDCNSCHTEAGTGGAPGRVLVP